MNYDIKINNLKQKAKAGTITYNQACAVIDDAIEQYINEFGTKPPTLLPNHYDNSKITRLFKERKHSTTTLEEIGDLLYYLAQREDQEKKLKEASQRSRIDWIEIEKSKMMTHDTMSDMLRKYTKYGVIDQDKAEEIEKSFRKCSNYECSNVFYIEHNKRHAKYCSKNCSTKSKAANERLKATNTILRQKDYIPRLDQTLEKEYRKHVFPIDNLDRLDVIP